MKTLGERLIYLICQPRSGSTLLQHILGSHSEIHTLPEPWFMLHLAYGLRSTGLEAEYNAQYAYLALKGFLPRISGGEITYIDAVRNMAYSLYENALLSSRKKYFLDKTARYYFIIPDLKRIFPDAKFIFLIRNPLAVLSSIVEVNFKGNSMGLFSVDRKHDILTAPRLILEAINHLGDQAAVVHYEHLVTEPEQATKKLCENLGLSFEPDMLNYGRKVRFEGTTFVDPKSIYNHQSPVPNYLEQWSSRFDTPQKIHIAKAYLESLGKKTVKSLGYSYNDLIAKLASPRSNKRQIIVPWRFFLTPPKESHWWERFKFSLIYSLQKRGYWGTFRRFVNFVIEGH